MYNIKTLMKAYFSVIKLADSCTSTDSTTLSNLYHLVKLIRSAIRDFPQDAVLLDEFKSVLDICSARLKKRVGKKLDILRPSELKSCSALRLSSVLMRIVTLEVSDTRSSPQNNFNNAYRYIVHYTAYVVNI